MPIDLTQFEQGDSEATPSGPRERLAALQVAQIVHGQRVVILFDGLRAAGCREALRNLSATWDPCHFTAHAFTPDDGRRHWLVRYWAHSPTAGRSVMFDGSWYRQGAEERANGGLADRDWSRRRDEINEFEAEQRDHGTILIKLFFQVTAEVQAERIAACEADPWRRWLEPADKRQASRESQMSAWDDLLASTNTRWAPWTVIDANGRDAGSSAALAAITSALSKAVPLDAPATDQMVVPISKHKAG